MRLILIVTTFIFTGCNVSLTYDIPDEFKSYVFQYETDKGSPINNEYLKIRFNDLNGTFAGACVIKRYRTIQGIKDQHIIYIDKTIWDILNDSEREILIYHELGHCDLGLGHHEVNSIMEPAIIDSDVYDSNRDYFVNELFGRTAHIDILKVFKKNAKVFTYCADK